MTQQKSETSGKVGGGGIVGSVGFRMAGNKRCRGVTSRPKIEEKALVHPPRRNCKELYVELTNHCEKEVRGGERGRERWKKYLTGEGQRESH